jgi:predicted ArsR family transcriptional regulator
VKAVQQTSLLAYFDALESRHLLARRLLQSLYNDGPQTCTELARRIETIIDNVRPTITDLKDHGLVIATDERRPTQYGRPSIVWALAPPETLNKPRASSATLSNPEGA